MVLRFLVHKSIYDKSHIDEAANVLLLTEYGKNTEQLFCTDTLSDYGTARAETCSSLLIKHNCDSIEVCALVLTL